MKPSVVFLIFLFPGLLFSQSPDLKSIRAHYAEVIKSVKNAPERANEGTLYCNRLVENVHEASWRAVGLYHKTVEFWYDDEPGMACEEAGGNEACHLQFITEDAQTGVGGWHSEFLYENGVLIFAFQAHEGGEYRYYWQDGKLFRAQIDDEIVKTSDSEVKLDAKNIWKEGQGFRKKYIDLF